VVGCRSVTSFTWPPSVQAVTVPPSKPSTIASSPPTKNPRSSSSPQLELRRLHDRQICRLRTLEDTAGVDADLTHRLRHTRAVTHEPAGLGKLTIPICRGHAA